MSEALDQLRGQLARAESASEVKHVLDAASALCAAAGAAQDFAQLDAAVTLRLACTRRGGQLLLAGQERVPAIDAELWLKRARMDEASFAGAVRRARGAARARFGALASPRAARGSDGQSTTLISAWGIDSLGIKTRFVCGVSPARHRAAVAAVPDRAAAEAALIREAVGQLGEMMAEQPKDKGGRPVEKTGLRKNPVSGKTLAGQGIDKNLADRASRASA
jgi:hypothetical protein